ncbi:uncharacterized protein MONOS_15487 [Monocercomonoides exilis]|uniref:uncharacterized protein n=1 Tax=Monocercomonoides exilis TaxID=2049356 RepID=UPI003559D800|nr:hypothetical protein MONOS_15487 [Monocercomonoides exilis]|eukprot:MONOS_15487.1-p1 / transcript=MONOS_15487.1 / gene=MONOS_15487 / organism=Monocercomonoides_exilis_PA203 / gene_product=unspecified product / transcript_product=unspecified product / location=Mono_scaffold01248:7737-8538(+) / protein_length=247 / sequence_SO=supercontig / SO=protein_coding / is_pseudo=false
MFSTPQTPLQAGLAPSTGSAMQIGWPTSSQFSSSQITTASSNIFSQSELELQPSPISSEAADSRTIDDLRCWRTLQPCYNEQDFSPVLQASPPASSRTSFWYRDALDRAGERVEKYLYHTFKEFLIVLQVKSDEAENHERMIKEAILMISQALHEARKTRIQGRYGFSDAGKMEAEATGGQLTKRQQDISEETLMELKQIQKAAVNSKLTRKTDDYHRATHRAEFSRSFSGRQFFSEVIHDVRKSV